MSRQMWQSPFLQGLSLKVEEAEMPTLALPS